MDHVGQLASEQQADLLPNDLIAMRSLRICFASKAQKKFSNEIFGVKKKLKNMLVEDGLMASYKIRREIIDLYVTAVDIKLKIKIHLDTSLTILC